MTLLSGIKITYPNNTSVVTEPGTVEEILRRLDLNPYEILVTRRGELLLADDECVDGDVLAMISIVHGG